MFTLSCCCLRKGASLGCEHCIYWLGRVRLESGGDAALEGMVSLHHAAMLGVSRAQTTLGGQMVWRSKTAQAQADGMLWLQAAAAQGHAYGCYLLAEALREGRGCEADPTGAAHWYQVGADKGDADCQAYLGLAYSRGDGVEKNLTKAHNLFSIASLQGGAWPTYLLGLSFEHGNGTDKDPQAAMDCYTQAAIGGAIRHFKTFMTGELYGLLTQHSILGRLMVLGTEPKALQTDALLAGVRLGLRGHAELPHTLFAARTAGLMGRLAPDALPDFLSGILLGAEIGGATAGAEPLQHVTLIGDEALCLRYVLALEASGLGVSRAADGATTRGQWLLAGAAGLLGAAA